MSRGKTLLTVVGIAFAAFMSYGFYLSQTPDGKERAASRQVIDDCRKTPEMRPVCLKLEADFRRKWNREP
jgi:hypothetical protein